MDAGDEKVWNRTLSARVDLVSGGGGVSATKGNTILEFRALPCGYHESSREVTTRELN